MWLEMYFECDWWLYMWAIGMPDFSSLPVLTQCLLLLMAHQESSRLVLRQGMWFIKKHLQVCMGRRSSAGDYSLWPCPTWHFLHSSAKGHLPTWQMVWSPCVLVCLLITFEDATLKNSRTSVILVMLKLTIWHPQSCFFQHLTLTSLLAIHSHTEQRCKSWIELLLYALVYAATYAIPQWDLLLLQKARLNPLNMTKSSQYDPLRYVF